MRRAVLIRSVWDRPRPSTPSTRQENRVWKIRCPRSPTKNKLFGRLRPRGRQKPQLRDADVLSLVDHAEVERWMRSFRDARREPREHAGLRQPPLFGALRPDPREDRPEQLLLLLGQPGLPAEPLHVAVVLPTRERSGVDHRVPFRPEEVRTETVAFNIGCRQPEQFRMSSSAAKLRRPTLAA